MKESLWLLKLPSVRDDEAKKTALFGAVFPCANSMQKQCKCIANAKLVHTVCYANAMQNYANKNKIKSNTNRKRNIKERIILTDRL